MALIALPTTLAVAGVMYAPSSSIPVVSGLVVVPLGIMPKMSVVVGNTGVGFTFTPPAPYSLLMPARPKDSMSPPAPITDATPPRPNDSRLLPTACPKPLSIPSRSPAVAFLPFFSVISVSGVMPPVSCPYPPPSAAAMSR